MNLTYKVTRDSKLTDNINLNGRHFWTAGFAQVCQILGQLGWLGMNWYTWVCFCIGDMFKLMLN